MDMHYKISFDSEIEFEKFYNSESKSSRILDCIVDSNATVIETDVDTKVGYVHLFSQDLNCWKKSKKLIDEWKKRFPSIKVERYHLEQVA
jgi:hypothetical protein